MNTSEKYDVKMSILVRAICVSFNHIFTASALDPIIMASALSSLQCESKKGCHLNHGYNFVNS